MRQWLKEVEIPLEQIARLSDLLEYVFHLLSGTPSHLDSPFQLSNAVDVMWKQLACLFSSVSSSALPVLLDSPNFLVFFKTLFRDLSIWDNETASRLQCLNVFLEGCRGKVWEKTKVEPHEVLKSIKTSVSSLLTAGRHQGNIESQAFKDWFHFFSDSLTERDKRSCKDTSLGLLRMFFVSPYVFDKSIRDANNAAYLCFLFSLEGPSSVLKEFDFHELEKYAFGSLSLSSFIWMLLAYQQISFFLFSSLRFASIQ